MEDKMAALPELEAPVIQPVEAADDITALDLEGEFDLTSAAAILEHARGALEAGKHVIVNLSGATFIDSSTIHALFKIHEAAKDAGRAFVLQFGTHAAVERVLELTGTDKLLPVAPTRAGAIAIVHREAA
jgi:anti-sigma B factor antagonist